MKKLTVLRHGKAQPRDPLNIPDRERLLQKRGKKDARRMGKFYAVLVPDLIVSSPAKRAIETATLFAENAGYCKEIMVNEQVYLASPIDLLAVLREQEVEHVLMVGHNPSISGLVAKLDGQDNRSIVERLYLATAATAHIVFKELDDWKDLQESSGQLRALVSPRFVKDLA
jgi:phosphohistidine phosphatase